MDARLHLMTVGDEPIAELSVVALVRGKDVSPTGYLPEGAQGTVVSVYGAGAAYEVEFDEPIHTLMTLKAAEIVAVPELSRDHIVAAAAKQI